LATGCDVVTIETNGFLVKAAGSQRQAGADDLVFRRVLTVELEGLAATAVCDRHICIGTKPTHNRRATALDLCVAGQELDGLKIAEPTTSTLHPAC